jgi:hypothetical protein
MIKKISVQVLLVAQHISHLAQYHVHILVMINIDVVLMGNLYVLVRYLHIVVKVRAQIINVLRDGDVIRQIKWNVY